MVLISTPDFLASFSENVLRSNAGASGSGAFISEVMFLMPPSEALIKCLIGVFENLLFTLNLALKSFSLFVILLNWNLEWNENDRKESHPECL